MKNLILVVAILQTQIAYAQRLQMQQMSASESAEAEESESSESRPQMTELRQDNSHGNESLKTFLTKLCEAASREDLDSYCSFFESSSPKSRKSAALAFAEHDVSMILLDSQVVSNTGTEAEVVVKYTLTFSRNTTIYLSVVNLKKIGNDWKIVNEKITKQFAVNATSNQVASNQPRLAVNPVNFPDIDEGKNNPPQAQSCPTGNCGKNKIPMGIAQGPSLDFDIGAGGCASGRCAPQQNNCASGNCAAPQPRPTMPAVFPDLEDF